jgi:hypothetical protein
MSGAQCPMPDAAASAPAPGTQPASLDIGHAHWPLFIKHTPASDWEGPMRSTGVIGIADRVRPVGHNLLDFHPTDQICPSADSPSRVIRTRINGLVLRAWDLFRVSCFVLRDKRGTGPRAGCRATLEKRQRPGAVQDLHTLRARKNASRPGGAFAEATADLPIGGGSESVG